MVAVLAAKKGICLLRLKQKCFFGTLPLIVCFSFFRIRNKVVVMESHAYA